MIYGYARISTAKQSIQRQIDNIKSAYPEAVIMQESYTGTSMDRPVWNRMYKKIKSGDTIVFDEVSRMSRNATEGFETYKALYDRGVNLVFLKESMMNTEHFRTTAQLAMTGGDIDCVLKGINEYLMILAEKQIQSAFHTAEHEVDFLHKRTREGIAQARMNGKQIGMVQGKKLTTKKSVQAKEIIRQHCKAFGGTLADPDVMKLTGVSRNSFYKYKAEVNAELNGGAVNE